MNNIHDKVSQFYSNNIINDTLDNRQETGFPNTGVICHYIKTDTTYCPSTNMGPPIHVG